MPSSKIWPGPYFIAPYEAADTELLICNAEIPVAEMKLTPPLSPSVKAEAARDYDLGTAEFFTQAANQKPASDELSKLFLEFIAILETREESDSGREFSPTTIQSCRCMVLDRLVKIMPEMKRLAAQIQTPKSPYEVPES